MQLTLLGNKCDLRREDVSDDGVEYMEAKVYYHSIIGVSLSKPHIINGKAVCDFYINHAQPY